MPHTSQSRTAIVAIGALAALGAAAYLLQGPGEVVSGTSTKLDAAGKVAEAKPPAAATSPAANAAAAKPEAGAPANSLIGLPVVASGGETVGQVLEVGKGDGTKTAGIVVKVVPDLGPAGTTIVINEDRFVVSGRSAQLAISLDDVKKMVAK